jgi:hypothetical protein
MLIYNFSMFAVSNNQIIDQEERPLRMPENYDFSQRKVNWSNYKKDYLLRTDAVWEKYKLYSYFYSVYKAVKI